MLISKTISVALLGGLGIVHAVPTLNDLQKQVVAAVDSKVDLVPSVAKPLSHTEAGKQGEKAHDWHDGHRVHESHGEHEDHKKHKGHKKHKDHKKHNGKDLTSGRVRHKLQKAGIIPSVITDFIPTFLLNVTYPSVQSPMLGRKLHPSDLQSAPTISLYAPPKSPKILKGESHVLDEDEENDDDDEGQGKEEELRAEMGKRNPFTNALPLNNLVVAMTDPDAPSAKDPKWSEICHWIAVGIPLGNISSIGVMANSSPIALKELMKYKPPGPPPKTGKHRYVLLAFTPQNGTSIPLNLVKPSDRQHWGYGKAGYGVKQWAQEMGLLPIAADYFEAKYHK